MRRRLDLAASLVERPELLFLDEPSTGLDPRSREQLWSAVRRLVGEGVTVVLTTQYLEEADQLADDVAVLDRGRIVARGPAARLKAEYGTEILRLEFDDPGGRGRALGVLGTDAVPAADERVLEWPTDGTAADVLAILGRLAAAGAPAARVSIRRPSLDDIFRSLTDPAVAEAAVA